MDSMLARPVCCPSPARKRAHRSLESSSASPGRWWSSGCTVPGRRRAGCRESDIQALVVVVAAVVAVVAAAVVAAAAVGCSADCTAAG